MPGSQTTDGHRQPASHADAFPPPGAVRGWVKRSFAEFRADLGVTGKFVFDDDIVGLGYYTLRDHDPDACRFVLRLLALGAPVWQAWPSGDGREFDRPMGWQRLSAMPFGLGSWEPGRALSVNCGLPIAVIDVDPRNNGDAAAVLTLLRELKVRVVAAVGTPSEGVHFYIAGHKDLPSVHSNAKGDQLPGYPGVDFLSARTNAFLPGTLRGKYGGRGYGVVYDDLETLGTEGDPEGAQRFSAWVAEHRVGGGDYGGESTPWDGTPPDARQRAYLDAALHGEARRVTSSSIGERNKRLFEAALRCGSLIAGAGMDEDEVWGALETAADNCGLIGEDGYRAVEATIRSGLDRGMANPRAVPKKEDDDVAAGFRKTESGRVVLNAPTRRACRDGRRRI